MLVWQLTERARHFEPIPGVPWESMSPQRFAAVCREYETRNDFPRGSLATAGWFELVKVEEEETDGSA